MKKLFAIGFLTLFALQFAGFYAYFGVRLIAIRQEMKALLAQTPEEQLQKIVISAVEFASIDQDESEIELNGKMYDIAKIKKQEGDYLLFALHDEHEDSLLSLLDEMVKRSTRDKKPVPSQLLQFLGWVFVATPTTFLNCAESAKNLIPTNYLNNYISIEKAIPVPPPWRLSFIC